MTDSRSATGSAELWDEARQLIAAYDNAMKSQKMNGGGADACLMVMANYGDLCIGLLRALLPGAAQGQIDRGELILFLQDLASPNLTKEAADRQAVRMADALVAKGIRGIAYAWQDISTAPKDREILLWYPWKGEPREHAPVGFVYIGKWHYSEDDGPDRWVDNVDYEDLGDEPTHWMPRPTPPMSSTKSGGAAK